MNENSILGQGSFAVVVGPFQKSFILNTGLFNKVLSTQHLYIIKIHKRKIDNFQQVVDTQKLYRKLHKQLKHDTIIFPLATCIIIGKDMIKLFPFMNLLVEKDHFYQLELEKYGGTSLENIIYNPNNPLLNVSRFLDIWQCIPNILEDCFHILFDNHLIITDVKLENIVLSSTDKLRLIDININPNKKTSRIITPYITELPPQYFSDQWWHPSNKQTKKNILQIYNKHYKQYIKEQELFMKKEKAFLASILNFIHAYKDPHVFIKKEKLSEDENKFQRLFFIIYPLFLMVILLCRKCVSIQTPKEKKHVKKIISFCLDILQKRGHFSPTFSYKTFQHFLWTIKTI